MYTCVCVYITYLPAHFSSSDLIYSRIRVFKGFNIFIKVWEKYYLKSIKEMKVGNYFINIFTALPSKILICVFFQNAGWAYPYWNEQYTLLVSLYDLENNSSAYVKVNVSLLCVNGNHQHQFVFQISCASVSCPCGIRCLGVGVSIPQGCSQN